MFKIFERLINVIYVGGSATLIITVAASIVAALNDGDSRPGLLVGVGAFSFGWLMRYIFLGKTKILESFSSRISAIPSKKIPSNIIIFLIGLLIGGAGAASINSTQSTDNLSDQPTKNRFAKYRESSVSEQPYMPKSARPVATDAILEALSRGLITPDEAKTKLFPNSQSRSVGPVPQRPTLDEIFNKKP
jgi:hypothetical protein